MRILVLLSRVPFPLIKGDKLRAFNQIKELSKRHEIFLCALSDKKVSPLDLSKLKPYCRQIEIIKLGKLRMIYNLFLTFLFSKNPLQTAYFYNRRAHRKVDQFIRDSNPDHIYCQLIRMAEYVKHMSYIPKTLDYMDSLSSGMKRRANKSPFYVQWLMRLEEKRLRRYEHDIFAYFDNKTIISENDRALIVNYKNEQIKVIENGVDQMVFKPEKRVKRCELLFTGNMSYPPNMECATYLIKSILPLVRKQKPSIRLIIAGANPGKKLRDLASENVTFTGWVEDLTEYYQTAKIFVAPMQIGSGLQNKLLEAMSVKLPCITSELANKSLKAKENVEVLIGQSAEHYAELIIGLLDNEEKASEIASNGYSLVCKHYDWKKSVEKLNKLIENNSER